MTEKLTWDAVIAMLESEQEPKREDLALLLRINEGRDIPQIVQRYLADLIEEDEFT